MKLTWSKVNFCKVWVCILSFKAGDVFRYHIAIEGWPKLEDTLSDVFYIGSRKRAVG
jgi:hypothetical protein